MDRTIRPHDREEESPEDRAALDAMVAPLVRAAQRTWTDIDALAAPDPPGAVRRMTMRRLRWRTGARGVRDGDCDDGGDGGLVAAATMWLAIEWSRTGARLLFTTLGNLPREARAFLVARP